MAHLSIVFCRQLAKARREKGITQSALAQAVGCKQSAISMLESGQPEKLSLENVAKLAELLGVALESGAAQERDVGSCLPRLHAQGYCPNAACYSNVPYVVQGELLFWPRAQSLSNGPRCPICGEVLESRCPQCGAPVTAAGACCSQCGAPRVTNTVAPETGAEAWAVQRRREIAEWTSLVGREDR
jgi:transcriptional regulator with XRE-family HTH domain